MTILRTYSHHALYLFDLWILLFRFDSQILEVRLQYVQKLLGCFIPRRSTYERHYQLFLFLSSEHTHKVFFIFFKLLFDTINWTLENKKKLQKLISQHFVTLQCLFIEKKNNSFIRKCSHEVLFIKIVETKTLLLQLLTRDNNDYNFPVFTHSISVILWQ